MQNRAIKYRIYPSAEQKILFAKTFGCCRKIWNLMLADKITYYQQTKKMLQTTPAQYKKAYPYLKEVDSLALANVQLHLQTAYKNFFRDKKTGFPKFKSAKHCRKSYTTNCQNGSIRIENDRIRIPKAGSVKAVLHRLPEKDWKIKSATISQYGDGTYYISVLFEYEETPVSPVPVTEEQVIGLDYKSAGLYTDSNGKCQNMPGYFRMAQKELAKRQRKLRHKVPGSKNYRKQQKRIARVYRHISNQRKDYLHKLSTATAKQYAYVCVEDLNMRSMSNKGFWNGKSTLDNGYGMFLSMLDYKLAERGGKLVKVDKFFPSSQICHCCGCRNPEVRDLRIREWICPDCGAVHDRDTNAAINIKTEGMRLLAA